MRLCDLVPGAPDTPVSAFALDHRKVAPGTVFGAFAGAKVNGEDFIPAAIANGAVAVVARPGAAVAGAVHVADTDPRLAFARLAARFFAPLPPVLVAVTGTNGKTSTVEMTRQLWRMAGRAAASIGTLGVTVGEDRVSTGLTTPDAVTFLSNLAGLAKEGVECVAFEASSHGLHQRRIAGFPVQAAAFTNLSRDHLDYHADMDDYLAAKLELFERLVADDGVVVVWADDAKAADVVGIARRRGLRVVTVGTAGDDWRLIERTPTLLGQTLRIAVDGVDRTVKLPLIGAYQAANALLAGALVQATGGDSKATLAGLERLQPIRGRLERAVITRAGAPVYVDYAHTPDAIEAAAAALRPHAKGQLWLVFGAGGDRDQGKRPEMGAVAARVADVAIVTDDNPRSEDAGTIRAAIRAAAPGAREIADRRAAIAAAVQEAVAGDVVLIAGKGHETGQVVGDRTLPFDDLLVARECAA